MTTPAPWSTIHAPITEAADEKYGGLANSMLAVAHAHYSARNKELSGPIGKTLGRYGEMSLRLGEHEKISVVPTQEGANTVLWKAVWAYGMLSVSWPLGRHNVHSTTLTEQVA